LNLDYAHLEPGTVLDALDAVGLRGDGRVLQLNSYENRVFLVHLEDGGAVVAKTAEHQQQLTWWANALGITGAPFDSFLTLRGLRTLDVRLRAHQENTAALVDLLQAHPAVRALHYPGLASHPGHALAARQQKGFGAMLSLELDGDTDAVRAFIEGLEYFTLAESLGGVESLIAHPATMTHAAMTAEARAAAGIGDGLLRLSVGIEHADDLVADIAAALDRALAVIEARKQPSKQVAV
jgi:cystathionine gamma-synthase